MDQQNQSAPKAVYQPRTYNRPVLRHYGDIRELTQGAGAMGMMDNAAKDSGKTSA